MSLKTAKLLTRWAKNSGYKNSGNKTDHWYYKSKLTALKDLTTVNVKLSDYRGNETFNLDVNNDSIDVLIQFLESMRTTKKKTKA